MRNGVLIAGDTRALRHFGSLLRANRPDLACFFWSVDGHGARSIDQALNGDGWFNRIETALADPRVYMVIIATPPDTGEWLAALSISAGKVVLVPNQVLGFAVRPDPEDPEDSVDPLELPVLGVGVRTVDVDGLGDTERSRG